MPIVTAHIGYIYKTENLVNGKIYIGQHQCDEFDEKYYGSGRRMCSALKKYGKTNFSVTLLLWANSVERLNSAEIYFIAAYDACNRNCGYNLSPGGSAFNKGRKASDATRAKQRESALKRPPMSKESRAKLSASLRKVKHSQERHRKIGNANKGKRRTDEFKEKNKIAHLGNKTSEKTKRLQSIANMGKRKGECRTEEEKQQNREWHLGREPWNKGTPCSDEMKARISKTKSGKPWSEKRRAAYERSKLRIAACQ